MEKVKLSELIIYYRKKCSQKEVLFRDFFEETHIEVKIQMLEKLYEVLGDVVMPLGYFKTFLYAGHCHYKGRKYQLETSMITDIYDIIIKYEDMPITIIDCLISHYDAEVFREYAAKEYVHYLISKYKYSDEVTKKYYQFMDKHKKLLTELYKQEREKLEVYKYIYGDKFIQRIQDIISDYHVKADDVIKLLPSKEFIDKSGVMTPQGYTILSGEDLVVRILLGWVDIDKFSDDEYIVLGPSYDEYVLTSFTKKEYLDDLERIKVKKLEKK